MLRSVNEIQGYDILATDGEVGTVDSFYFDDHNWAIRYLVVETGGWLLKRRVLISPAAIDELRWAAKMLVLRLTREQIKESPEINLDKPVSHQHEVQLHQFYGWQPYWIEEQQSREKTDMNLRSTREVTGYDIQAEDGPIGHVEDFLVDDQDWRIRYMVIDTREWLPGKKMLLAPEWVAGIDWYEQSVFVAQDRKVIKDSPEFDPRVPVTREYEEALHEYYCYSGYWD